MDRLRDSKTCSYYYYYYYLCVSIPPLRKLGDRKARVFHCLSARSLLSEYLWFKTLASRFLRLARTLPQRAIACCLDKCR